MLNDILPEHGVACSRLHYLLEKGQYEGKNGLIHLVGCTHLKLG